MAASQFKRYVWLVDTIRSAGRISREEIDRRWANSVLNDKKENCLHERTFFRYKNAVEELFDIEICCDRAAGGLYYIADNSSESLMRQWLFSQFAVQNSLHESRQLSGRILYEDIPNGTQFLTIITEAMRNNLYIKVSHQRFDSSEPHVFNLAPYCLKVFKQRWYVLGKNETEKEPRIYALDRIHSVEPTNKNFILPKNFDAQSYFNGYYGVFRGGEYKPTLIKVKVNESTAPYLRSLPLHSSQKEPKPCLFTWYVAPTFDFVQQLRTLGSSLEVLEPASLREKFAEEVMRLAEMY